MGYSLVNWLSSATCVACACVNDSHWRAVRVSDKGSLRYRRREVWSGTLLFLSSSALCFASDRGPLVYSALRYLQVGWETAVEPSSWPAPEPAQSLPVAPPGRCNPNRTPPCEPGSPGSHRNWARFGIAPSITSSRHTRSSVSHHAQRRFHHSFIAREGYRWVANR